MCNFLPLKLGKIQNFSVRIQLYTVPGQVRYNSTRKLVLSGTDGVVFVADSQKDLMEENLKSFRNLIENLKEHGLALDSLPHILQFNKRDLPNLASVEELDRALNPHGVPGFETCATTGEGVLEGLSSPPVSGPTSTARGRTKETHRHTSRWRTDTMLRPAIGLPDDDRGHASRGIRGTGEPEGREPAPASGSAATSRPAACARRGRAASAACPPTPPFTVFDRARRLLAIEAQRANDGEQARKLVKDLFSLSRTSASSRPTSDRRISMLGIRCARISTACLASERGATKPVPVPLPGRRPLRQDALNRRQGTR